MKESKAYQLFPFRFKRFGNYVLIVNEGGEFVFIKSNEFSDLIENKLGISDDLYKDLKSKHIIVDSDLALPIYLTATKLRTKKSNLIDFTALHIFVVTLRCNQKCRYCQTNSVAEQEYGYDMSWGTAKKYVEYVFKSPSPVIKIEFQGGEPSLNYEVVKRVVNYSKLLNRINKKKLEFVLCTNLLNINQELLSFIKDNDIWISTSLDGPKDIHNANRVSRGNSGTYDQVINNIRTTENYLGKNRISALMVTTDESINRLKDVIDEYVNIDRNTIFIRTIHPYGRANRDMCHYDIETYIEKYKAALDYIIKLNLGGTFISEQYATILLTKILTPFSSGFIDLQSPAGTGISCAVYGHDGNIYPSDEARMLAAMGDNRFCMGNVNKDSYNEVFNGTLIHELIENSILETLPLCSECAFQKYCGVDPIRSYVKTGRVIEHTPTSEGHKLNCSIIRYLLELIKAGDRRVLDVFWSWILQSS